MIDLTAIKKSIDDAPVAVFGLGLSGMASTKALLNAGITVHAWDDNLDQQKKAADLGAVIIDLSKGMSADTAFLVLAPGVPLTHPTPHAVVQKANELSIEILSDIELFHRALPNAKTIGITGTNGKSTTTSLIAHILHTSGQAVEVGGNLGLPVLAFNPLDEDGFYVIELSSYQLDLCPTFKPDIGVLLNITPDHLDRHGDLAGYAKAKSKIFGEHTSVISSIDDSPSKQIFDQAQSHKKTSISLNTQDADIYVDQGILYDGDIHMDINDLPSLKGLHNQQNAAAAYAACRQAGISADDIQSALKTFPGLEHRQKTTRILSNITFVNDSKATNDEAAAKALSSFHNIYWIAGGLPKSENYPASEIYFDRIRHAYLIGGGTDDLIRALDTKNVPHTHSKIIHAAVFKAYEDAVRDIHSGKVENAVVLLSPACASFDQFTGFEQRGYIFTECVDYLPNRFPITGKVD